MLGLGSLPLSPVLSKGCPCRRLAGLGLPCLGGMVKRKNVAGGGGPGVAQSVNRRILGLGSAHELTGQGVEPCPPAPPAPPPPRPRQTPPPPGGGGRHLGGSVS